MSCAFSSTLADCLRGHARVVSLCCRCQRRTSCLALVCLASPGAQTNTAILPDGQQGKAATATTTTTTRADRNNDETRETSARVVPKTPSCLRGGHSYRTLCIARSSHLERAALYRGPLASGAASVSSWRASGVAKAASSLCASLGAHECHWISQLTLTPQVGPPVGRHAAGAHFDKLILASLASQLSG